MAPFQGVQIRGRFLIFRLSPPTDSPDAELIELLIDEDTPLGLQIRSSHHHSGVFIHHLVPGSLSDQCGLLQPGDRVLEANGHDLKFVTVDDAASIISVSAQSELNRYLVNEQTLADTNLSMHAYSASLKVFTLIAPPPKAFDLSAQAYFWYLLLRWKL